MKPYITIKLFATLSKYTPRETEKYPITPGTTVRDLLALLGVPEDDAKLIFIDNIKGDIDSILYGGERIAVFPPVGGG